MRPEPRGGSLAGFRSPEPENRMSRLAAIEDCVHDTASHAGAAPSAAPTRSAASRRTGAGRTTPRPGRRSRTPNPSRFSPAFVPILTGFCPAFALLFRHNPLKYNNMLNFRRRRSDHSLARSAALPPARADGRAGARRIRQPDSRQSKVVFYSPSCADGRPISAVSHAANRDAPLHRRAAAVTTRPSPSGPAVWACRGGSIPSNPATGDAKCPS